MLASVHLICMINRQLTHHWTIKTGMIRHSGFLVVVQHLFTVLSGDLYKKSRPHIMSVADKLKLE